MINQIERLIAVKSHVLELPWECSLGIVNSLGAWMSGPYFDCSSYSSLRRLGLVLGLISVPEVVSDAAFPPINLPVLSLKDLQVSSIALTVMAGLHEYDIRLALAFWDGYSGYTGPARWPV
jgi:hypothetical protein